MIIESLDRKPQKKGDWIPVRNVTPWTTATDSTSPINLVDGSGMSGLINNDDVQDNDASGDTMWLSEVTGEEHAWVTFDFGAVYPLGEMWVWNYNQGHEAYQGLHHRGMKNVTIHYSMDNCTWTELKGEFYPYQFAEASGKPGLKATNLNNPLRSPVTFGGVLARYVRITAGSGANHGNWGGYNGTENYYGLSAVRFYAASGIAVEQDDSWTDLLHCTDDWSGSDGINSIPLNGNEFGSDNVASHSIFLFGDTFIGAVDKATDNRISTTMINNTLGLLTGVEPDATKLRFHWYRGDNGEPKSVFVPSTPKAKAIDEPYYWLQDGASIGGTFYCFPLIVGPDPSGPEGFQFAVHGVTRIAMPTADESLEMEAQEQVDTPLYFVDDTGCTTYFGAALLPNTEEAGAPNPDGYVYVYGLRNRDKTQLVAARVPVADFEDFACWRYWDGSNWGTRKESVAPIAPHVSCELSVSPMRGGFLDGKYVLACQMDRYVSIYLGDNPIGPFQESIPIHYCEEPDAGKGIYVYNAKGHPHLSPSGELLISYNVNTTEWDSHMKHAEIYRPRFIRLRQLE